MSFATPRPDMTNRLPKRMVLGGVSVRKEFIEKKSVYTQRFIERAGAFEEDALTIEDAIAASSTSPLFHCHEFSGNEIVHGLD
ncbi:hypothetical protein GCM10010975_32130 [Comamonas phosphati]|nr:hypothetical protein GCM10010975_32130 [Comamonas phosphati]